MSFLGPDDCPPPLARWLEGDGTPPEEIYRACAEIVLLDEPGSSA